MPEKKSSLIISEELHKEIKVHCAKSGTSIKEFVETGLRHELLYRREKKQEREDATK